MQRKHDLLKEQGRQQRDERERERALHRDARERERAEQKAAGRQKESEWRQNQEHTAMRLKVLGVGFVSLQELLRGLGAALASKVISCHNIASLQSHSLDLPCQRW